MRDTTLVFKDLGDLRAKVKIKLKLGDPKLSVNSTSIETLPYPKTESYELLQGNNSNPTHNHKLSRYAFDFTMQIGDTICASQNAYVIASIEGYKGWGMSNKWKSYSNQIILYDTSSHLFTMYGHLTQNGSLVEVGDYVQLGQPIAISGKTGQTSEEHLHFNVLQAHHDKSGLISYRLDSIGNYKVDKLKRHQLMKH